MTKKNLEAAHFGPFGSKLFLQMAQIHTISRGALRFATQISLLLCFSTDKCLLCTRFAGKNLLLGC